MGESFGQEQVQGKWRIGVVEEWNGGIEQNRSARFGYVYGGQVKRLISFCLAVFQLTKVRC
jgi:hypothetical protein